MQDATILIWIGIGVIVASALLIFSVFVFAKQKDFAKNISEQERVRNTMQEYRKYNSYSDKVVYAQDVKSLIMEERGALAIRVLNRTSLVVWYCSDQNIIDALPNWYFDSAKKADVYTVTAVASTIDDTKRYKGELSYGLNGEVIGITFKQGSVDAAGNFIE